MSGAGNGIPSGRVRLREVAGAARVSVSTASRVLNGDPTLRLRDDKRDRVLRAANDLGYRPNAAGRSLRTNSTGAIGVMVPTITNPYFADLLTGIEDACDAANLTPILGRSERITPGSTILARMIGEGRVDGFVLQLPDRLTADQIDRILDPSVPRVLLQSRTADHPGAVLLDVIRGVAIATEHLISLGHTAIALATGHPSDDTERGFRSAMVAAGLGIDERWVTTTGFSFENGLEAFRSIWSAEHQPSAIVAANVDLALGVLHATRAAGVAVPQALSVVSLHDSTLARQAVPPLTAVRMPVKQLGATAVRHLCEILGGTTPETIVVTEPVAELTNRSSTRARRNAPP